MVKTSSKSNQDCSYPSEWKPLFVGDLVSIATGSKNTQDNNPEAPFPFFVRSQKVERIDGYSFDKEAVLTAGDGVGTGKIFHYINGKFDAHQRVYILSNFADELHGKYFFWQFSNLFFDRIMSMTAKSSVDSVRQEMISGMPFPLPTLKEQQSISEALDDSDKSGDSLEKLIKKKQLVLSGIKAQLFSAAVTQNWTQKTLNEVTDILLDGTHHTPSYQQRGIPFYSVENVTNNDFKNVKYVSKEEHIRLCRRSCLKKNDILFTRIGSLGDVKLIDWNVDASFYVSLAHLRFKPDIFPNFAIYMMGTPSFQQDMLSRALLNATPKKINLNELSKVKVQFPNLVEQERIAFCLDNMVSEIAELKDTLSKAKKVKAGMMQELLTGSLRLI